MKVSIQRGWPRGLLLLGSGVYACAAAPPRARVLAGMVVVNASGQAIARIEARPCDSPEAPYVPVDGSAIDSGGQRQFVLPLRCADLRAVSASGETLASQSGSPTQGLTWRVHP